MPRTLRFRLKIILTLTMFLALAMALSDVVLTLHHQKNLIISQITKARETAALVSTLGHNANLAALGPGPAIQALRQTNLAVVISDNLDHPWYDSTRAKGQLRIIMNQLKKLAQISGKPQSKLQRGGFTIFGPQYLAFIEARPIMAPTGQNLGSVIVVADLAEVNNILLKGQRLFLLYCLFNLAILVFLAYLRLAKLFIHPIQGLAKRAEEYHDEDDFLFISERPGDDYATLSSSLNNMLRRIKKDRATLQDMVNKLEDSNHSLRQAQEEVIRAEKLASVGRLSAGIAHEIGNPLGIVLGYLELLQDDGLNPEARVDCLQRAMAEIQRINTIIRQLLDLARPSASQEEVLACHELLEDICQTLGQQPLLAKMTIDLDLTATHDQVQINDEKLRQVLLNIILNAADACANEPAPHLLIRTSNTLIDQKPALEISLEDNGPGIAAEHLNTVFDPFFTTKEPGKGTGLGLSVSYMIITAANGNLTVSNGEQGGKFVVTLPLVARPTPDGPGDSPAPTWPH